MIGRWKLSSTVLARELVRTCDLVRVGAGVVLPDALVPVVPLDGFLNNGCGDLGAVTLMGESASGDGGSGTSSLLGPESSVSVSDGVVSEGVRAKWAMSPSTFEARSSSVVIVGGEGGCGVVQAALNSI